MRSPPEVKSCGIAVSLASPAAVDDRAKPSHHDQQQQQPERDEHSHANSHRDNERAHAFAVRFLRGLDAGGGGVNESIGRFRRLVTGGIEPQSQRGFPQLVEGAETGSMTSARIVSRRFSTRAEARNSTK